jgi:hypothetical protein
MFTTQCPPLFHRTFELLHLKLLNVINANTTLKNTYLPIILIRPFQMNIKAFNNCTVTVLQVLVKR